MDLMRYAIPLPRNVNSRDATTANEVSNSFSPFFSNLTIDGYTHKFPHYSEHTPFFFSQLPLTETNATDSLTFQYSESGMGYYKQDTIVTNFQIGAVFVPLSPRSEVSLLPLPCTAAERRVTRTAYDIPE